MIPNINDLRVKIFADGADLMQMTAMAEQSFISGLTTNPTLMRNAGILDYEKFAKAALQVIKMKPISFEIFSDDLQEMKKHGKKISSWGENVYVKVPITTTSGKSTKSVIDYLVGNNVKLNITAVMNAKQVLDVANYLNPEVPSYVSVFAGRISDTGRDPIPILKECIQILANNINSELIWASPRELLNIIQANEIGCHIITVTNEILSKIPLIGKDLNLYSLETVCMFYNDALAAGYSIKID
jgi:transaldolase